jgi:uncharacterized protein YodC (DUF2158 family)
MQIGTVVKHKKSGKMMTVEGFNPKGHVKCVWFENNNLRKKSFVKRNVKVVSV